ncbi:hypothetical protein GMLC_44500 [Geomonas limicola]|uniref:Uncharacterized protein n=1 Tax=Geomonas limicola TaxID=2740186 RepID=A0A6V8NE88_9BACT|nr:glycosyltransferase family 9 protein [Geomonas limicola]GFO70871.1 hypothetical protein GMLC_44500 [Geomonas limicola]
MGRLPGAPFPEPARPGLSICICTAGGVGDLIITAHLVQELHAVLEPRSLDLYYPNEAVARFVFHHSPCVDTVLPAHLFAENRDRYDLVVLALQYVKFEPRDPAALAVDYPEVAVRLAEAARRFESFRGFYDRQPALDGLLGRIAVKAGRQAIANLGYFAGLDIPPERRYHLVPAPDAYPAVCRLMPPGTPYLTVHDGFDASQAAPGSATKCWPLEHWIELVRSLKARLPELRIVQLGAASSRPIAGVDLCLVNQTTLAEAAWLIKGALLHVDTESGLVHLARTLATRSVVLFGPTDRDYYGYPENLNLSAGECGNCWWSTPDWLLNCPRGLTQPACMAAITPDRVCRAVLDELGGRRNPEYRCQDLSLYDRGSNAGFPDQLETICAGARLAPDPGGGKVAAPGSGPPAASRVWGYRYALERIAAHHGARRGLRVAELNGGGSPLAPYLASLGHQVQVLEFDRGRDAKGERGGAGNYRRLARECGCQVGYGSPGNLPVPDLSCDVVLYCGGAGPASLVAGELEEALRTVAWGGLLVLSFGVSTSPTGEAAAAGAVSCERLASLLGRLGIAQPGIAGPDLAASAHAVLLDGVAGVPAGATLAGLAIAKLR